MSHHVNFSKRQAPARERLKWVDLPTAALVSETGFKKCPNQLYQYSNSPTEFESFQGGNIGRSKFAKSTWVSFLRRALAVGIIQI